MLNWWLEHAEQQQCRLGLIAAGDDPSGLAAPMTGLLCADVVSAIDSRVQHDSGCEMKDEFTCKVTEEGHEEMLRGERETADKRWMGRGVRVACGERSACGLRGEIQSLLLRRLIGQGRERLG